MLTLIAIILLIGGIFLICSKDDELGLVALFAFVVVLFIDLICVYNICTSDTIDKKIAMYEEENAALEAKLDETVIHYMQYESGVFKDISIESPITLIPTYPDLNSNELVIEQFRTYNKNKEEIVSLKEKKINVSKKRWLVYFGK